jgi:formylglycine-generating enzyme required for sulfatase activity/predicted Ser/Thr protein kinase
MAETADVRIPGFTIERELGRGAMGVVYLAHEVALGRDVALKVLRPGFGGDGEDARRRFEREVRAAARLEHPNIVPILSTGEAQGRLWFAMQFVPGETLDDVLTNARHGRIPAPRAARIVLDVALALHAAHEAGVTHRDVKPGNVMLVRDRVSDLEASHATRRLRRSWLQRDPGRGPLMLDRPLLADFGLAADSTASKLSESGMLIGTPGYMAPEQYRGHGPDVGPHSDQWALGVVLYECLTGTMPFPTGDLPTLARLIGTEDPIPPSRLDPRIDRDLETICLTCLRKNPRERYPDCKALAQDLERWLREEPIAARPPGPWRRLRTWGRRRPARATALLALLLAGLVALAVFVGVRANRAARVSDLSHEAADLMRLGQYEQAERVYDQWIGIDPSDGRPRDGRALARARRGMATARESFEQAQQEIVRLKDDRTRYAELREQALHGSSAQGGSGLGTENARGSEPWWMRQASYAARREMETLQREIVRLSAEVAAQLAIARSRAEANAEAAGGEGLGLRNEIVRESARWHMEEWRAAVARGDAEHAALHEFAVRRLDPQRYAAELDGVRTVTLEPADPPGRAWLFRYEREGDRIPRGGPRLLPAPYLPDRPAVPLAPAYRAAVAARLAGEGRRRVAPDVPSLTPPQHSDETTLDTLAGPMFRTRYEERLASSAYPLATSEANALGRVDHPLDLRLIPGRYLVLLRRDGYPDLRLSFQVGGDNPTTVSPASDMDLMQVPRGFVLVPGGEVQLGGEAQTAPRSLPRQRVPVRSFLASRYEITYADWWAFLNDDRTLAAIDAALHPPASQDPQDEAIPPELRFVPRVENADPSRPDTPLPERPPGVRRWPSMAMPEHPCAHISLYDLTGYLQPPKGERDPYDSQYEDLAEALRQSRTVGWGYLAWRTERSRRRALQAARGGPVLPDVAVVRGKDGRPRYCAMRFTLPTQPEWERMARGSDDRTFVYGDEREWLYFKGARSRPHNPAPEAVGLFVDDESLYGVRDLTGSVAEWTADWDGEGRVFWIKGSAWGSQVPEDDRIAARRALAPTRLSSTVGARVIVRVLEPVRAR